MIIKEKLSLVQNSINLFDFPQSTIDPVKVSQEDVDIYLSMMKLLLPKMKDTQTKKYVDFHVSNGAKFLDFVTIRKYPLVAAYNKQTKRGIINLAVLSSKDISNINSRDLYALTVYAHVCSMFTSGAANVTPEYAPPFADFYASHMLNIFSKTYGLTGSYQNMIPMFKFLTFVYIYQSFFGIKKDIAMLESARFTRVDPKTINLNFDEYDFTSVNDYIIALNKSQIMPGLVPYRFLDRLIRSYGIINLGVFEDCMRFCSTIFSSSVAGNNYFPVTIEMTNPQQYRKVNDIIDFVLKKAL